MRTLEWGLGTERWWGEKGVGEESGRRMLALHCMERT